VHECLLRFKEHRLEDRIREAVAELAQLTEPEAREVKLAEFMRIQTLRNALRAELQRVV
jgi:hypothetical protein